ncbi:hypothetical protein [Demequina salsinemoris]|uniref:hypothetical protein n=1 Tax=Demequina salsinemoris TaxID=577470 RepID=UPI000782F0D4|nr:hypothetical protein [Demequina salsinemoris]
MMLGDVSDVLAANVVLAYGGGGGDGGGLGFFALLLFAAGPAAGWGTWTWIQRRYRNREARYRPDRTVAHHVSSLTGDDQPRGRFRSRSAYTSDRNDGAPDQRARHAQYFHGELRKPEAEDEVEDGVREGEAEPAPPVTGTAPPPPPASSPPTPPPPTR